MSTFFKYRPTPGDEDASPVAGLYSRTEFSGRCAAIKVYLVIGDAGASKRSLHEMLKGPRDHWSIALSLKAGSYRYHYYADHRGVTTYVRPDEADDAPRQMDGFDAKLVMPPSSQNASKSNSRWAPVAVRLERSLPCAAINLLQEQGA
jgi:hypothetical protein